MDILYRIDKYLNEAKGVKGSVFTVNDVDKWISGLKNNIKAPYVNVYSSNLGGDVNVAILITISIDEREEWKNKILENSKYVKLYLQNDGVLEYISGSLKFRKTTVKDLKDATIKINKFIEKSK